VAAAALGLLCLSSAAAPGARVPEHSLPDPAREGSPADPASWTTRPVGPRARPVVAPPRRLERKTPLTPDALLQPARRAAPSAGPCVRRLLRKKKQKGNQNSNPKSNGN